MGIAVSPVTSCLEVTARWVAPCVILLLLLLNLFIQLFCYNREDRPYEENVLPVYLLTKIAGKGFEHPSLITATVLEQLPWDSCNGVAVLLTLRIIHISLFFCGFLAIYLSLPSCFFRSKTESNASVILLLLAVCVSPIAVDICRVSSSSLIVVGIGIYSLSFRCDYLSARCILSSSATLICVCEHIYGLLVVTSCSISLLLLLLLAGRVTHALLVFASCALTAIGVYLLNEGDLNDIASNLYNHYWAICYPNGIEGSLLPFLAVWKTIGILGSPMPSQTVASALSLPAAVLCIITWRHAPVLSFLSSIYVCSHLLLLALQHFVGECVFVPHWARIFGFLGVCPFLSLIVYCPAKYLVRPAFFLLLTVLLIPLYREAFQFRDREQISQLRHKLAKIDSKDKHLPLIFFGSRAYFTVAPYLDQHEIMSFAIVSCNRITCDKFRPAELMKKNTFGHVDEALREITANRAIVISTQAQKLFPDIGSAFIEETVSVATPCYSVGVISAQRVLLP